MRLRFSNDGRLLSHIEVMDAAIRVRSGTIDQNWRTLSIWLYVSGGPNIGYFMRHSLHPTRGKRTGDAERRRMGSSSILKNTI